MKNLEEIDANINAMSTRLFLLKKVRNIKCMLWNTLKKAKQDMAVLVRVHIGMKGQNDGNRVGGMVGPLKNMKMGHWSSQLGLAMTIFRLLKEYKKTLVSWLAKARNLWIHLIPVFQKRKTMQSLCMTISKLVAGEHSYFNSGYSCSLFFSFWYVLYP